MWLLCAGIQLTVQLKRGKMFKLPQTEAQLSAILWLDSEQQRWLIAAEEAFQKWNGVPSDPTGWHGVCALTVLSAVIFSSETRYKTTRWSAEECVCSHRLPEKKHNTTDRHWKLFFVRNSHQYSVKWQMGNSSKLKLSAPSLPKSYEPFSALINRPH